MVSASVIASATALLTILTPVAILIYKLVYNGVGKLVDLIFGKKDEKLIFKDVNEEAIKKGLDALGVAGEEIAKLSSERNTSKGKTYKIKSGNVKRLSVKSTAKRVRK